MGHVVGENIRRLRATRGLTQSEAARQFQAFGLSWTRSHIAAVEGGNRETVDGGTLIQLACAFDVPLTELFAGEGPVRLSDEAIWTRKGVRDKLSADGSDEPWTFEGAAMRIFVEQAGGSYVQVPAYQADAELAARLGLRPDEVITAAEQLWGRTLHQERDQRIGEMGEMSAAQRRARRGHVTRQLAQEIEAKLKGGEE